MQGDLSLQLRIVQDHANFGRNQDFLDGCKEIRCLYKNNSKVLAYLGSLYIAYGFPSQARQCYLEVLSIFPEDLNALINLGHSELLLGNINGCRLIFEKLLNAYPNDLRVLQNLIFFNEYDPDVSNDDRISTARRWGNLAIQSANGPHPRPSIPKGDDKKIRVGYVSGDICQHTVGLLVKNIIAHHARDRFEIYVYNSGNTHDWVTNEIQLHSVYLDIRNLDDQLLASQIRKDRIDILVDLSGHTGGSRLSAFAYRPAPIQLSWLGYYATTGLEYIDGVILDRWHLSPGIKKQFIEPIIELSQGRWCYAPAFPAPATASPPCVKNGFITFGSFNNTLKYNQEVFELWSRVLKSVPNSRLILKWRTFNDIEYQKFVLSQFEIFGIDVCQIELRGPSFHLNMLEEYQDIDIALDPFPFSGGITSCEALYMGVPVVTLPQDRTVSRQTSSYLNLINRSQWIATSKESYLRLITELASNPKYLIFERSSLRRDMILSPLMQINSFINSLERLYISYQRNFL